MGQKVPGSPKEIQAPLYDSPPPKISKKLSPQKYVFVHEN